MHNQTSNAEMTSGGHSHPQKTLSSKQQQELEKKQFECNKYNTDLYNKCFLGKLEIDNLLEKPTTFDELRNDNIYWTIRQLSREKISVEMVAKMLEVIFETGDVEPYKDDKDLQFEIIAEKFKFLQDLAQTCKLSTEELLKFSSRKIFSQITKILIMNTQSICLIDYFIGVDFFKNFLLPKSWFYLMKNDEIDQEKIQIILKIKWQDEPMIRENDIKKGLYECIGQTACSKKLTYAQKKSML